MGVAWNVMFTWRDVSQNGYLSIELSGGARIL